MNPSNGRRGLGMGERIVGSCGVLAAAAIVAALAIPAAGQTAAKTKTAPATKTLTPRTADGHPDLQGIWSFATVTPLERPSELRGKEVLTNEEAAEFEKQTVQKR